MQFKHEKNNITIDNVTLPLSLFMVLEPEYTYPKDLVIMLYDGKKRHYRSKSTSWTIIGSWDDGERYIGRVSDFKKLMELVNKTDAEDANRVKSAGMSPLEKRKAEYPTIESLVVAMWEKVVENRDSAVNVLQAQREAIKAKYPLEEPVNVELHKRDNLNEGGTEGVRPKSKRAPRSRSKHSGRATGGQNQ